MLSAMKVTVKGRYVKWRTGLRTSGWWCRTCMRPIHGRNHHERRTHGGR